MPQTAEFEEKTYEKYFGHELVRGRLISFSPGQRAENLLGFDEAFHVPWHILLRRFRHLMPRPWSRMSGIDRNEINKLAEELSDKLPEFRFNLFVQFKRPEYVSGLRGAERKDWQRAYYRYFISTNQQETLEKLHAIAGGRAAVVYASPALWTTADLFVAAANKEVIRRSNVVSVDKLAGHGRFTYVEPGGHGKAYSDPVHIESPVFDEIIEAGLRQKSLRFNQHIKRAARQIEDAVKEDENAAQLLKLARLALLGDGEVGTDGATSESFWFSLATIEAFSDAFNVSFYAMG
jgi:hypothetical protein